MKIEQATEQQREVIESDHPFIIVLAGPGSGKTATTVARIKRLMDYGAAPAGIVAITFTNDAARELESRLCAAFPETDEGQPFSGFAPRALGYVGTLHGFCMKLLREHGQALGYGARLAVISAESAEDLLLSISQRLGCKTPIKDLLALKAKGRPARGYRMDVANTVVASYFDELKESGIVDFDLLLSEALQLLDGFTASLGFSYLFVDEVQDSAAIDWKIFTALPIANKCLVGDSDQGIYSFRGGNVNELIHHALSPETQVIKLESNFRSHDEICCPAQSLIEHNGHRLKKATVSVKGFGGKTIALPAAHNAGEEIGIVARAIKDLLDQGIIAKEVAVLARTNAIAHNFRPALTACGFPVVQREASGLPRDWFFARAMVEFLVDPENDCLAFFYLVALFRRRGAEPLEARVAAASARRAALAAGKSINRANIGMGPARFAAAILTAPDYARLSMESRMTIADIMLDLPAGATAAELGLAMASTRDHTKTEGEGVEVLTIHAAKGREWDVVFLVGLEDEVMPGRNSHDDLLEEERRIAYVAMTRARNVLILTHALSRVTPWGEIKTHKPSRFFAEAMKGASA